MRRAHSVWALVVVVVVGVMLGAAASTEQPEGVCTGIGWGCQVSGSDLAVLVAMLVVTVAVVILLIGHGVISAIGSMVWRRPSR